MYKSKEEEFVFHICPKCKHYKNKGFKFCKIVRDIKGNIKCLGEEKKENV